MTLATLKALHTVIGDAIDDIERVYLDNSPESSPSLSPSCFPGSELSPPPSPLNRSQVTIPGRTWPLKTPPSSPGAENDSLSLLEPYTPKKTPRPTLKLKSPMAFTSPKPLSRQGTPLSPKSPLLRPPLSPFVLSNPFSALSTGSKHLDFPSLDAVYDPNSPEEQLTAHPIVLAAINRIVAASGQLSLTVQKPFLSLCDASMGYHLPSCLRFLENAHIVEILREAGPAGLHVEQIAEKCGRDSNKLSHILRLLATHHILREVTPNVFANNRISSCMDTGEEPELILQNEREGRPEKKYEDTNGVSAFVGMCTDEIFKASAYMTEAFGLDPRTRFSRDPTHTPFNRALETSLGYFGWLEGIEPSPDPRVRPQEKADNACNQFRLARFGKAMTGTSGWETPGLVFQGFDWASLPADGVVVDVGGGIGSTSMILADAFKHLTFIVQERQVVVELGEKAWRARCPELLDTGRVRFEVHDFFTEQPVKNASVFLLRVVLHDWPDHFARRILMRLREAATEDTKLLIADFVLPLACVDDLRLDGDAEGDEEDEQKDHRMGFVEGAGIEGAERSLAGAPLLANLGKASANVYWMDLTMQAMFNSQERTLREIIELAASAGWKVVRVTTSEGLFGHITAVPAATGVPYTVRSEGAAAAGELSPRPSGQKELENFSLSSPTDSGTDMPEARSRCATPTFGSRLDLPSVEELARRFGGSVVSSGRSGAVRGALGKGIVLNKKPLSFAAGRRRQQQQQQQPQQGDMKEKKRPSPLGSRGFEPVLGLGLSSVGLISPASPTMALGVASAAAAAKQMSPRPPPQVSCNAPRNRMGPKTPLSQVPLLTPKRQRSASTRRAGEGTDVGGSVLAVAARIDRGLPLEPAPEE